MRISCPNCAAEYDVPDEALAAGPRMLRCARCQHRFEASLPAPLAATPAAPLADSAAAGDAPAESPPGATDPSAAPAEETKAEASPAETPPPLRAPERLADAPTSPPDRFALAGWVLTLLVLVGVAYAGFAFRAEVMAAWPPAQRLYGLLGLA
ncbi:zinc-ribbon domain-containing protein [Roseomonas sp. F4]